MFDHTCPGCGERRGLRCDVCRSALLAAPLVDGPPGVPSGPAFDGVVKRLVVGLKYRRQRMVVPLLVDALMRTVAALPHGEHITVVTWAPTTARRRRRRGADQAELLARALARRLGVRCRPLLRKVEGPSQTGQGRAARLHSPCFVAHPLARRAHVLLVDDVVTTGATLAAAAGALRAAGAASVQPLAVAVTPSHVGVR
jgi:ComF family protein